MTIAGPKRLATAPQLADGMITGPLAVLERQRRIARCRINMRPVSAAPRRTSDESRARRTVLSKIWPASGSGLALVHDRDLSVSHFGAATRAASTARSTRARAERSAGTTSVLGPNLSRRLREAPTPPSPASGRADVIPDTDAERDRGPPARPRAPPPDARRPRGA
jgi:hypothetical protein